MGWIPSNTNQERTRLGANWISWLRNETDILCCTYETMSHAGCLDRQKLESAPMGRLGNKALTKAFSVPQLESSVSLTYRVRVGRSEPKPRGFVQTRTQPRLKFWSSNLRPLEHRCRPRLPTRILPLSMVTLNKVKLPVVLPSDEIRLVMMQPHVNWIRHQNHLCGRPTKRSSSSPTSVGL
jgi:hypothetical protein